MAVGTPQLLAWGSNNSGQLGDGTTTNRPLPVAVADSVVAAAAGYSHSLFVKADRTLWAMGYNGDTDLSRLHYASLPPIGSLDKPEGAKQICDLARTCQAELVIIGTFARAVEGAENDADTVRNFYRWTAMNLKQEGRSLMRIDHAGKDLKKGARGTSAKNDDVDLVWQMTKVDGQLVLIRQKHRHTWIPERINLIIHDQAQMFTQDIKGGERLGQAMKMLEELNIDPALSQDAMWTLVKDRAENIYKVSRKTTRLAHKQRKDQADENLLEDF